VPEHLALAEKYRARAEELRRIAATLEDAESREKMLTLADEYANMARAEERKSTLKSSGIN
jgi:geranylgeranyl pyrophosphate synthase